MDTKTDDKQLRAQAEEMRTKAVDDIKHEAFLDFDLTDYIYRQLLLAKALGLASGRAAGLEEAYTDAAQAMEISDMQASETGFDLLKQAKRGHAKLVRELAIQREVYQAWQRAWERKAEESAIAAPSPVAEKGK